MAVRKGWNNLSQSQRDRYTRTLGQGDVRVASRLYNRGVDLGRARGHGHGAAAPAPKSPGLPAEQQGRLKEIRRSVQDRIKVERATWHLAGNVGRGGANADARRLGKADVTAIKARVGQLSDAELDSLMGLDATEQREWFRTAGRGPFDAAQLWYHGMEGWNA